MADDELQLLRDIRDAIRENGRLLKETLAVVRGDDEEAPVPLCPHCGNTDNNLIQDTSVMGNPRLTCIACKKSWSKEAARG